MANFPSDHNELQLDTIFSICNNLNRNGKVIGFTHGTFDLFHYGHLEFLRESKRHCDFLMVAIECDKNVMEYKPGRPIITEERRREIIAELGCVDTAFIVRDRMKTDNYRPYKELYEELKVNVVTYGRDFGIKQIVDLSQESGAKAQFIDTDKDSTTAIIRRIVKDFATDPLITGYSQ